MKYNLNNQSCYLEQVTHRILFVKHLKITLKNYLKIIKKLNIEIRYNYNNKKITMSKTKLLYVLYQS